jgi:hypothetical protein
VHSTWNIGKLHVLVALLLAAVPFTFLRSNSLGWRASFWLNAPSFVFKARLHVVVAEATDLGGVLFRSYERNTLLRLLVNDDALMSKREIFAGSVIIILLGKTPGANLTSC